MCTLESGLCSEKMRFDDIRPGQKRLGLVVGYGKNLRIPSGAKDVFSFDTVRLCRGRFVSPRKELAIEAIYQRANTSRHTQAVGAAYGLRRYFLIRGSTAASFDITLGYTYFLSDVASLGTRGNFTESLGITLQRALDDRTALTIHYRFCHTSNAGIKLPNIGINSSAISLGLSWYPSRDR